MTESTYGSKSNYINKPNYQDKPKIRIGELLLRAGRISAEQLQEGCRRQRTTGERLGSALIHSGAIRESELAEFLSGQLGYEAATEADLEIDPELVKLLPSDFVKRFEVVVVRRNRHILTIAMANPNNLAAIDDVRFITGCHQIRVIVASEVAIRRVIEEHYSTQALLEEVIKGGDLYERAIALQDLPEEEENSDVYELRSESEAQPIILLINFLLIEAVRRRASDIHLEPYQDFFRVRMRIDGLLHGILAPPKSLHRALISRVKVMARMDISKTRVPQDGHLALEYNQELLHFRVNTVPTVHGEKCVIRTLQSSKNITRLDRIGMPKVLLEPYQKIINCPQGLLIVTGPTGSGKTTTVHASLEAINHMERNIITLEDPVEMSIPGINHVQIQRQSGMTFVEGLRAVLRQDPDTIFVGEMRDREVARIGMEAAMTGHLVFSTLHTNSAAESLARLADMGVEMFLVAGTLLGVVAQRLLRRICPQCKQPATPSGELKGLMPEQLKGAQFSIGLGCNHCMRSGYKGRVPIFEILYVDDEIRQLIRQGSDTNFIERRAQEKGMKSLAESALELVLQGITTPEELRRVIGTDILEIRVQQSSIALEGEPEFPELPNAREQRPVQEGEKLKLPSGSQIPRSPEIPCLPAKT